MKRSAMLQRQLKANANMLSAMYKDIGSLRKARKQYNDKADEFAQEALQHADEDDFAMAGNVQHLSNEYRSQAKVYTPYVNVRKKQIKSLEELQRFTKRELQQAYTIEHFDTKYVPLGSFVFDNLTDQEWLRRVDDARAEGDAPAEHVDALVAGLGKLEPIEDEV